MYTVLAISVVANKDGPDRQKLRRIGIAKCTGRKLIVHVCVCALERWSWSSGHSVHEAS